MSVVRVLKILCQLDFPTGTVRLWEGAGPYVDANGDLWRSCALAEGALETIELAINAEAYTLELGMSGIDRQMTDLAWQDHEEGNVIDSRIRILIQECDAADQPVGDPEVRFTGTIDNIRFDEAAQEEGVSAAVIIECTNRFALRGISNGAVLSDVDQKARSAILNPESDPDRFCERVPSLGEKTINWPAFN